MSSKSPVFPISEPQHFSDYGFDGEIDYFQVLLVCNKLKITCSLLESKHKPMLDFVLV